MLACHLNNPLADKRLDLSVRILDIWVAREEHGALFLPVWAGLGAIAALVAARQVTRPLLSLGAVALTGLVSPSEALSGFSNPAVVTVWAVFIVSGGLTRSGVADLIARQVVREIGSLYDGLRPGLEIRVVLPDDQDREFLDQTIYNDLALGRVSPEIRQRYHEICARHIESSGIDSVILGCTELPLVIRPADLSIPVLDTTVTHVAAILAAARALSSSRSLTARAPRAAGSRPA